jgi:hypothetical protein
MSFLEYEIHKHLEKLNMNGHTMEEFAQNVNVSLWHSFFFFSKSKSLIKFNASSL